MARNVRNSYVNIQVDGRATDISTGPISKDGGMVARFKVRDDGCAVKSVTVSAWAARDGTLRLTVEDPEGNEIFRQTTTR